MFTRRNQLWPKIQLKFEPRDIWVGVYWEYNKEAIMTRWLNVYLCILPMLPIRFRWIWYSERYWEEQRK